MIVSSGSGVRYKNLAHFIIRWSRHGSSGAFNVFVVFALLDFHFSNVALKCSPLAAWMLDEADIMAQLGFFPNRIILQGTVFV